MLAVGVALAVPAVAAAGNGGAAPAATTASNGGASGGASPDAAPPVQQQRGRGASSAKTGGAIPNRAPLRKVVPRKRATRRATPPPGSASPTAPVVPTTVVAPPVPGVFPVQGAYGFGERDARFGAGRPGHIHQGQDVVAGSGTPVVAPVSGSITVKANQPGGAGIYLVLRGTADGRDYVFMHLERGSVLVAPGTLVTAGQQLAQVGATGAASGPHLHFEIWVGGWQARGGEPVDPLPQLEAWAAG